MTLADRLRTHVETLAGRPRPPGSAAHREAARYVRTQLESAGFRVLEDRHRPLGLDCCNLLTEPVPDDDALPLFIVGAHYDSITHSPGADDNASGVAALLELAFLLAPRLDADHAPRCRLQLAAYDLEESGLVGSDFHSRRLRAQRTTLRGMIALEMLGYTDQRPGSQRLPPHLKGLYPDVGNFIAVCGNEASRDLVETFSTALRTIAGLPVEHIAVPGRGEMLAEVRLSDHSSFWDAGYPGLMITDTSFFRNPHYHQKSDTPQTLDYAFLARVTEGVAVGIGMLLRVQ